MQVGVAVPERDRLGAGQPHRARGVAVVQRAREGDDTDAGGHASGLRRRIDVVLDDRVGEQRVGEPRICAERGLVGLALDLDLEALALPDVGDAVEAEPGQRAATAWPCGSRISGLSMTSTTTRATGLLVGWGRLAASPVYRPGGHLRSSGGARRNPRQTGR